MFGRYPELGRGGSGRQVLASKESHLHRIHSTSAVHPQLRHRLQSPPVLKVPSHRRLFMRVPGRGCVLCSCRPMTWLIITTHASKPPSMVMGEQDLTVKCRIYFYRSAVALPARANGQGSRRENLDRSLIDLYRDRKLTGNSIKGTTVVLCRYPGGCLGK
ncbi:hypothetical protein IF2G_03576 [Cordyceps javanica]|nr:hypothetical protein IF2G_03576 [Cordyceps javanica]